MSATATGMPRRIGDQQPVLAPHGLDAAHDAFGRSRPASTKQGQQFHRGQHHLARDDLVAAANGGDAGQDPEPACIGPSGDIGDVAAPAGGDFVNGEIDAWRQAHDQYILLLTEDRLCSNLLQPAS